MLESRLDGGGELTAEDVFNCFRDLWEDARAGTGLEQKPPGNLDGLLRQLPWMGRVVTKTYRQVEGQVLNSRRQAELAEKTSQLEALTAALEGAAAETEALAQKERQLLAQEAKLDSQAKKKAALQQSCAALTQRLNALTENNCIY